MNKTNNAVATKNTKTNSIIKTKLKFTRSERSGAWVGFVAINPVNGYMRGVKEDEKTLKMVCVVSREIEDTIEEGILYDVEMIPMCNKKSGYIVIKAKPHLFAAHMESTVIKHAVYQLTVKFGNKTITYDPKDGKQHSVRTIEGVVEVLRARKDVLCLNQVIEDFIKSANLLYSVYQNDGYYVGTKRFNN